jgi:hypothetical protein
MAMASEQVTEPRAPVQPPTPEAWAERERVASHFNDVLMRFRLHALVGLGAIGVTAGVLLGRGAPEARCGAWSWLLVALGAAWSAVAFLDIFYYRRMRLGAVQAMLRLEEELPEAERFSTTIDRYAAWGARWAPGVFYGLVLGVLGAGLRWSQAQVCTAPVAAAPAAPVLVATGAHVRERWRAGECVMPDDASGRETIVKIVGVTDASYRVFTHTLSAGELLRAEDYKLLARAELETGHTAVECPALAAAPPAPRPIDRPAAAGDKVVEVVELHRALAPVPSARPAAASLASQRPRLSRPLTPVLW